MRCSHFFPTVCLYWANSHQVHKCKTDSWVTAVKVGCCWKKGQNNNKIILKNMFFLCWVIFSCTFAVAISIKIMLQERFIVLCNIFLYICCCNFNQNNAKKTFFLCCVIFSCTFPFAILIKIMLKKRFLFCVIFSCTFAVAISIKVMLKKNVFFVLCYIFLYISFCDFNQNNAKKVFLCCVIFSCTFAFSFQSK